MFDAVPQICLKKLLRQKSGNPPFRKVEFGRIHLSKKTKLDYCKCICNPHLYKTMVNRRIFANAPKIQSKSNNPPAL